MKVSFLFLSCLMLLLGLCSLASAEESGGYTVMCQNLRAPSSKELADPALSPAHRSELFKTLLAQYAPDVVGLQEAKGVMAGTAGNLSPGHGLRLYGGRQNQPRRAGGYTAILYKQSRFELLKEGVFWLTDTPDMPSALWTVTCATAPGRCCWIKRRSSPYMYSAPICTIPWAQPPTRCARCRRSICLKKPRRSCRHTPKLHL